MINNYKKQYEERCKQTGQKLQGRLLNDTYRSFVNTNIKIINDDLYMKSINMRFIVTTLETGEPIIVVSDDFIRIKAKIASFAIWHEIGHIHHRHFDRHETQDEIRKARIEAINQNKVVKEELEADRFAVKRVGVNTGIKFLKFLLESRPTGEEGSRNELGRKELELRIKYLQDYENKRVRKEILKGNK